MINGIDPDTYAYLKGMQRTNKQIRHEARIEAAWNIAGYILGGMLAGYIIWSGIALAVGAW